MPNDVFDAIRNNDPERLESLLKSGLSANAPDDKGTFSTPLMRAIDRVDDDGDLQLITLLITHGADVNAWVGEMNPLLLAISIERRDVVRLLLDAGASPDFVSDEGRTPLLWALENDDLELMRQLLQIGVPDTLHRTDPATGRSPLGIAVETLNKEMTALLLAYGADPYFTDADYQDAFDCIPNNLTQEDRDEWEGLLQTTR